MGRGRRPDEGHRQEYAVEDDDSSDTLERRRDNPRAGGATTPRAAGGVFRSSEYRNMWKCARSAEYKSERRRPQLIAARRTLTPASTQADARHDGKHVCIDDGY